MTTAAAASIPQAQGLSKPRLDSVDALRGLVMVLMALDHTRDYFSNALSFDPTDLTKTYPALFLTRWITHFCAPVFIFLAGTGAFLSTTRGKSRRELSWFLLTRGLWCIILELTFIRCFGWTFNFNLTFTFGAVFWAIGWSMVALAGLVFLPLPVLTICGAVMIGAHNAFDSVTPDHWGSFGWLWKILHSGGQIDLGNGFRFAAAYPLIPWVGVMAAGYGFGALVIRETNDRRRRLFILGIGLTLGFIAVRGVNGYGDPRPWTQQKDGLFTLFSFLNCHKYPPSLSYLLMTLGPALIVLGLLDRGTPRWLQAIVIFGRVPLFYYLVHLPLIHGLSVIAAYLRHGRADWLFANPGDKTVEAAPPDFGFNLPVVYVVWIGVVLALYPACRWFADIKRRHRGTWLSYL